MEILDDLKKTAKNSNRLAKLLNRYAKKRENSIDNAYILEKKICEIERSVTDFPDCELKNKLQEWLEKEKKEIENLKEDFRFKFGKDIATLFAKDRKTIKGQYPIIRVGIYTLKIDLQFGEAELFYGPEIEKVKSKIPLQPKIVYETIKKYDDDLRLIKSTPDKIYEGILRAYNHRLKLVNKQFSEKVLLTEVLNDFVMMQQSKRFFIDPQKTFFHEYSRPKLSYLVYYLKKNRMMDKGIRLHVATFDATTDKMHSLWVPENEEGEGTHYSHISFEKVGNTESA